MKHDKPKKDGPLTAESGGTPPPTPPPPPPPPKPPGDGTDA
jgi:hypothetical protein